MAYSLAAEYFTSVGAVFTRRSSTSQSLLPQVLSTEPTSSHRTRASSWVTFQAGEAAAAFSLSPRLRTSANSLASSREIWFSSVRALTICPSEVLVASGSR